MKKMILVSCLILSSTVFAEDKKTSPPPAPPPVQTPKMTTKDAKKTCKEQNKKGADLVQCMKDAKEEK
jgi:hypothetical protein